MNKQRILEEFHRNVKQYAVEYPGVFQVVFKFVEKADQGKEMSRDEAIAWMNTEPYEVPLAIQDYVLSEIQRTQTMLYQKERS